MCWVFGDDDDDGWIHPSTTEVDEADEDDGDDGDDDDDDDDDDEDDVSRGVAVSSSLERTMRAGRNGDASATTASAASAFLGTWTRDSKHNQHVVAYLVAHGVGADAVDRSRAPYEQTWTPSASGVDGEFTVRTTTPGTDRTLTYPIGAFVEKYETSAIFGKGPGR